MSISQENYFWSSLSPLGGLTGAGLLIMASSRLSWAIILTGSLIWVYGLTSFTFSFLSKKISAGYFPKTGRTALYTCFASFWGSIYLFLFWLLCPFAALEVFFLLMLVPLLYVSSEVMEKAHSLSDDSLLDTYEYVSQSVYRAIILAVLLIIFSIIREPLAYCSLSFPGTYKGMILIFKFNENSILPVNLLISSSGALILLGYFIYLYQYLNKNTYYGERK